MLDVVSARDLKVQTEPLVFGEELVQVFSGGGLHRRLQLAHPGKRRKCLIERQSRLVSHAPCGLKARFLRQHGDSSPARNGNLSTTWGIESGDDAEERRFSSAIDTNERHVLSIRELERHVVEDMIWPERLGQIGDSEYR